ncbi:hypothetical protein J6590_015776 [Homalodisca vitripennis]|nr:hypothetical protein J6590_015776 [Homalodisca vitripennis]
MRTLRTLASSLNFAPIFINEHLSPNNHKLLGSPSQRSIRKAASCVVQEMVGLLYGNVKMPKPLGCDAPSLRTMGDWCSLLPNKPLSKEPAQEQISEQPRAGGAPPVVGSGTNISSSLFYQLCGPTECLHCVYRKKVTALVALPPPPHHW